MAPISGQRQTSQRRHLLQVLGGSLVLVGAVSIVSAASGPPAAHPLDSYPGFGRSPDAALRDDTYAYWEAFRRERVVEACMADSGFLYAPDVAFPSEAMLAVASGLRVEARQALGLVRPSDTNRAYDSALSPSERDRYFMALFGESAADIKEANRTGQVPTGRADDFAEGGCTGKAAVNVGSIWDLRRSLATEYAEMHRATFNAPELSSTRDDYRACAAQAGVADIADPAELDRAFADGRVDSSSSALANGCDAIWEAGYRRAEAAGAAQFVRQHQEALRAASERYRNVMSSIRGDAEFLTYLSTQVAFAPTPVED